MNFISFILFHFISFQFPVHFRHSNVNNCIDKTLFRGLFFPFFNILSGNNMSSVKRQLSVKSLEEKCQPLRELVKGLSNKDVAEKYGVPKNTILTWIKNKSKYFAALEQSSNKRKKTKIQWLRMSWPRMLEILQRFESLHVHDAARKQSSNLSYFNQI